MTADRRFDAAARSRETRGVLAGCILVTGAALAGAYWSGAFDPLGARSGWLRGGYDDPRSEEQSSGSAVFLLAAGDDLVVRYDVHAQDGMLRVTLHEYTRLFGDGSSPRFHSLRGETSGELTMPASRWGIYAIRIRPVCPETPTCDVRYEVEWSRR